ncbi:MAG TPA: hypothetical protein VMA30_21065 [Xanthobacteraceae bacterium]|nr:hypothetical protein [Xanthobacteraceae bacterium]
MPELNLQAQRLQAYDVYFTVSGGPRFVMWNNNHGVTVSDRDISYSVDGKLLTIAFTEIAAIHLNNGTVGENTIDQCKIEFNSGATITVSNATSSGLPNEEQTRIYRDFVYGLHGRLAAVRHDTIRFVAGMSGTRYKGAFAVAIIAGLFFIALPLVLAIVTGDAHALILTGSGAFLIWPFMRILRNNTPRNYTPDALPDELIS